MHLTDFWATWLWQRSFGIA